MGATIHTVISVDGDATYLADKLVKDATEREEAITDLIHLLESVRAGTAKGKVTLRVDSSVDAAATLTVVCDQSDGTDGDQLILTVPGLPAVVLTGLTTGAVTTLGQVAMETSDTVMGDNLVSTIKAYPPAAALFSATNSTGTVTITCKRTGTVGNGYKGREVAASNHPFALTGSVATPVAFAGGADVGARPTGTVTITHANLAADDAIKIAGVTLTWKVSAANENQVTIGSTDATDATALAAAINAHTQLKGVVSASAAAGVVTLTYWSGGRDGEGVALTEVTDVGGGMAQSGAALAGATTDTWVASAVTYTFGVA
jgi:phage tail sheath gpL-like